jgi:hypothetical protein
MVVVVVDGTTVVTGSVVGGSVVAGTLDVVPDGTVTVVGGSCVVGGSVTVVDTCGVVTVDDGRTDVGSSVEDVVTDGTVSVVDGSSVVVGSGKGVVVGTLTDGGRVTVVVVTAGTVTVGTTGGRVDVVTSGSVTVGTTGGSVDVVTSGSVTVGTTGGRVDVVIAGTVIDVTVGRDVVVSVGRVVGTGRVVETGRVVGTGGTVTVVGGMVTGGPGRPRIHVSAWSVGVSAACVETLEENPYPPKKTRWPRASSAITGKAREGGLTGAFTGPPTVAQPVPSQIPSFPLPGGSPRQPPWELESQLRLIERSIPLCNCVVPEAAWKAIAPARTNGGFPVLPPLRSVQVTPSNVHVWFSG